MVVDEVVVRVATAVVVVMEDGKITSSAPISLLFLTMPSLGCLVVEAEVAIVVAAADSTLVVDAVDSIPVAVAAVVATVDFVEEAAAVVVAAGFSKLALLLSTSV